MIATVPATAPALARHTLSYRPDIDGLRALAVIGVLLFHAGVPGFSGGYVGVDIFFVISGYLITLLLIAPGEQDLRRRLANFYLRRCRRILPALLLTMLVCSVVAVILLLPADLVRFGSSLRYGALLAANFSAWFGAGYFDAAGTPLPLLHLWSIAVEEQFYLLYPLLLLSCTRLLPRHRVAALGLLTAASFALWLWGSAFHARANYYFTPSRAWELLIGALLALGAVPRIASRRMADVVAVAAVAGILLTFVLLSPDSAHSGLYAVVPVLAAAALIVCGEWREVLVVRGLSSAALVFIGLISYSLYLWHAPLLIFTRYYNVAPLSAPQTMGVLVAIFVLSVASWRWVERPVRSGRWPRSNVFLLLIGVMVSAALWAGGTAMRDAKGWPQRLSASEREIYETSLQVPDAVRTCLPMKPAAVARGELCHFGARGQALPKVLLWGDSHAIRALPVFELLAREHPFEIYFGATSSCRPLFGVASPEEDRRSVRLCQRFNRAMASAVGRVDPDVVVLDARWLAPSDHFEVLSELATPAGDSLFSRGLQDVVRAVGAPRRRVCVVLGVPVFDFEVPYALIMTQRKGADRHFMELPRDRVLRQYDFLDGETRKLEARGLLRVVDPKKALCPDALCRYASEAGEPLYVDSNHLALPAVGLIAPELARCLRGVVPGFE